MIGRIQAIGLIVLPGYGKINSDPLPWLEIFNPSITPKLLLSLSPSPFPNQPRDPALAQENQQLTPSFNFSQCRALKPQLWSRALLVLVQALFPPWKMLPPVFISEAAQRYVRNTYRIIGIHWPLMMTQRNGQTVTVDKWCSTRGDADAGVTKGGDLYAWSRKGGSAASSYYYNSKWIGRTVDWLVSCFGSGTVRHDRVKLVR